jgi:two-component system, NarL family, response regulator NreC
MDSSKHPGTERAPRSFSQHSGETAASEDQLPKKITVLLVDDHRLVRSGFRRILQDEEDFVVVGEAGDASQAIQMVRELAPNVTLLDSSLPGLSGLLATPSLIASSPQTAVLMVSMHTDQGHLVRAFQSGARGYLVKNADDIHLVSAIRRVVAGELVFPDEILRKQKQHISNQDRTLTARERQIVQLVAQGQSNREIANYLRLSLNTISAHRGNIMKTLRIHKTADLVRYAIRNGLANTE